MKKIFLFFLPFCLNITINILPQACCTAGTFITDGAERTVLTVNSFSAGVNFRHNVLNSTYQSTNEIVDPLNRTSTVNNFSLEVEYGLVKNVSLLIILPYTNKTRETTVTNTDTNTKEDISFSGKGLGDVVLLGKYEIITPNIVSTFGFALGGGAKLPTGSFEEEEKGTRLSIDLQPGTGSSDLLFWSHLTYAFPSLALSFNANLLYKYSGVNLDGYRYGDELLVSVNGTYAIADFFGINIQLKGRTSDRDYWQSRFLPSTGGTYFDITPGLVYYEGKLSIRVFTQFPLYRNLQGIQLAVNEMLGAGISYVIDLK
jgi:hypothetical protein